jgi:hypothetical protein
MAQTHRHQQPDRTPTHDQHRHTDWLAHGDPPLTVTLARMHLTCEVLSVA